MMLHQDGSTHEWVPGRHWDLIITLDDATSEHDSMFFVEEEGTASSFRGMAEVIETRGLPSSLSTDRGSHYWLTPEAGGKVDRERPTKFGRAMRQLGVEMIPAYSPEARGRCERMFATHQERLPKELAGQGIDTMQSANRYLAEHYRGAFNEEFAVLAAESGTAFVPFIDPGLADIVCEHHERTVNRDNCVSFEGKRLQIPTQTHRCHFIKAPRSIAPPTGVWQCSTGRTSSPGTSPMAPSSHNARPRRCAPASEPGALAERLWACGYAPAPPLSGALDLGLVHVSVSWAGAWAWRTRAAPTHSRCRPAPRLAPLPAAAVGQSSQPRPTPLGGRPRIGNQHRSMSAATLPTAGEARSAL